VNGVPEYTEAPGPSPVRQEACGGGGGGGEPRGHGVRQSIGRVSLPHPAGRAGGGGGGEEGAAARPLEGPQRVRGERGHRRRRR